MILSGGHQTTEVINPLDAFGRIRVSNPLTIFGSKQLVDGQALFWDDQATSGSGTSSTYTSSKSATVLGVSNATAGVRTRQTYRWFNYQPGKSQLLLMTFAFGAAATGITRRAGLFTDDNGVFLEQTSTGPRFVVRKAASDTVIPQSSWNADKLDGTGPTRINLDLSKVQIFFVDYEWLGVGSVRFGFVINGTFVTAHRQHTANIGSSVYHTNPNLPCRYELRNDGSGAAATLDAICCSVTSEGGIDETGLQRSIDRVITPFATNNDTSIYPILGIRLKSTYPAATVRLVGGSILNPTNSTFRWVVGIAPTYAGTALTWTDLANSAIQFCNTSTNGTTVSNTGVVLTSGYEITSSGSNFATSLKPLGFLTIGTSIAGVAQELWLMVQRISGGSEDFYASLQWEEQV